MVWNVMSDFAKAITAFLVALFALTQLTDYLEVIGREAVARNGCGGHGETRAMLCLFKKWAW